LWFDEDASISVLENCFLDAKKLNVSMTFSTVLIDKGPFLIFFNVFPDGLVLLMDKIN